MRELERDREAQKTRRAGSGGRKGHVCSVHTLVQWLGGAGAMRAVGGALLLAHCCGMKGDGNWVETQSVKKDSLGVGKKTKKCHVLLLACCHAKEEVSIDMWDLWTECEA